LRQSNLPFSHQVTGSKGAVPLSGPGAEMFSGLGPGARSGAGKLNALDGACIAAANYKTALPAHQWALGGAFLASSCHKTEYALLLSRPVAQDCKATALRV
jgi:hypothetical protein